ncbi:MAG TPA: acyl-ACP--UDP-N-acetylglucosamine O-acyltransferase [Gammaproteobacteria bacterium]|nr:acyl-ACP--UDP-N-acetylglucosamine O-acyltransferase [Gammaproteobacteria bacterium]
MSIHPTAIVSERAKIAADAEIGPYCVIEGEVEIGSQTVIESHVRIGSRFGRVTIGSQNHILAGAAIGGPPQDLTYKSGAYTALTIGSHNRIGEFVTIHIGTAKGGGVTRIGDHCFIMTHAHVAHDCQVGDHVIMVNSAQIGGHVIVEHHAVVGGCAIVTQLNRVGAYSFMAVGAMANKDLLPYSIIEGHWAAPRALNRVGLKRAGIDAAERRNIDKALRLLLQRSLTVEEALARIEGECEPSPQIAHLLQFVRGSERGIARG